MGRNLKFILVSCILILLSSFKMQAQVISNSVSDDVYYYFTKNIKKGKKESYSTTEILIYNDSKDTIIIIHNFNKYVPNVDNRLKQPCAFYWDYLTLSNQIPDFDIVVISGGFNKEIRNIRKFRIIKKYPIVKTFLGNVKIVIPPNELFISEVYIEATPKFVLYPKGYYKLCLFYAETEQCVAEIIVKE